jgi:GIY-YIG catalytic domain
MDKNEFLYYNSVISIKPIISYANSINKKEILEANKGKTGIYKWTHIQSGKSYVGSAIDIAQRLKNYYNLSYLKKEVTKNKSMIYKALIKYGYSYFKLEILEYCDSPVLISREQYYLDKLNPEYNILKTAGNLTGFKHSKASIKLMGLAKLGRSRSEDDKLKISMGSSQAYNVIVINNNTSKIIEFRSIRKASKFICKNQSYIAKCLKKIGFYKNEKYTVCIKV